MHAMSVLRYLSNIHRIAASSVQVKQHVLYFVLYIRQAVCVEKALTFNLLQNFAVRSTK